MHFVKKKVQVLVVLIPNAGIHINPTPGTLVLAIHRELGEETYDGFVQDYHFCPNHRLFTYEKSLQKP